MSAQEAAERFISFGGSVRLVLAARDHEFRNTVPHVSPVDAEALLELRLTKLDDHVGGELVHFRVHWLTLV